MKQKTKFFVETVVIASLLLTNVLMGFFTKNARDEMSFLEKISQTLTPENLAIALFAGIIATAIIHRIR